MRALVTGGAGFIGSNLTQALVERGHEVRVLDDLSTGFREHVSTAAQFIAGSIADLETVETAMRDVDVVFHHAASRAVSRSVQDPLGTDRVNTHGSLNVLVAARDAGAQRVVLASSSSVYGGVAPLPTGEDAPLTPRSPYAVSKLAVEQYARVFWELYGLETVSLRYFNVFGPRQRPDSPYAAVIPLFIEALAGGVPPTVFGDGQQTRDFTFVDDVVAANFLAATAPAERVAGRAYNIARGGQTSLLQLLEGLGELLAVKPAPRFAPKRPGDVDRSCADIGAARRDLGYSPAVEFHDGLRRAVAWFRERRHSASAG